MIFGSNKHKGFSQRGTVTEGSTTGSGAIAHGADGGVNIGKAKNGRRTVQVGGNTFIERDAGSGLFLKSTGGTQHENYVRISDYNPNPAPAPAPAPRPSGGGGGGSSRPSGGTPSYGTTAPSQGNTGNSGLDSTTAALMEMVASLTATLSETKTVDKSEISKPAGSGLGGTILSNTYIPNSEKKKKSYLTPIAVG